MLHYLVRQKTKTKPTVTQEEVLYKQIYTLIASLSGEKKRTKTKTTVTQEEVLYKQNYTLIASVSGEKKNENKNDCNARRGAVQGELHAHCFTIW